MFIPPHCPNPECRNYSHPASTDWYQKRGHYPTYVSGPVPRFRCKSCRKGFSSRTFSIDYYAKKKVSYLFIYTQINSGAGIRNIARNLEVRDSLVTNRIHRMARSAILVSQMILDRLPFREDLVLDGIQNFCGSQYFPDNTTILVGKDSQFVYDSDYATIRRSGRMTLEQKKRRAELEMTSRASSKALEHSFARLAALIVTRRPEGHPPLILYTDEKSDYSRVLWNHPAFRDLMFSGRWRHHMTNSKDGRNTRNPLFAVNYIDREIRKDIAGQARETVQFPRNVSNAMLKMNLYLFDHNVRKPYRINDREKSRLRHVQMAGMDRDELDDMLTGFLTRRVFKPVDLVLSESARMSLMKEWKTPLRKEKEVLWKHLAA
jgi:transposase-like protein